MTEQLLAYISTRGPRVIRQNRSAKLVGQILGRGNFCASHTVHVPHVVVRFQESHSEGIVLTCIFASSGESG